MFRFHLNDESVTFDDITYGSNYTAFPAEKKVLKWLFEWTALIGQTF
jgi:hypothetical protein